MRTWWGPPLCDAGSWYCMFSPLALSLVAAVGPPSVRVRPSSSAALLPPAPVLTSRIDPSGKRMSLGGRLNSPLSPSFLGGLDPPSMVDVPLDASPSDVVVSVLAASAGLAPGVG